LISIPRVGAVFDEPWRGDRLQNMATHDGSYRPSMSIAINLRVLAR